MRVSIPNFKMCNDVKVSCHCEDCGTTPFTVTVTVTVNVRPQLCTDCMKDGQENGEKSAHDLPQHSKEKIRNAWGSFLDRPPPAHFFSPDNLGVPLADEQEPIIDCIMTGVFDRPIALRVPESLWLPCLMNPEIKPGAWLGLRIPSRWVLAEIEKTSIVPATLFGVFGSEVLNVYIPLDVWQSYKGGRGLFGRSRTLALEEARYIGSGARIMAKK
ncbi:hypothetical protein BJ508DRAFT_320032 [Ascobolus immersus RN42]|uniref:Uncharacterized protein n=1 Tax=Ascobolus immersus RN42 TaxID=1160509 RepID=A0A3N4IQB6_ASCIM|nr:hypothetical protein BJ508DRAFT_320032 [Ascobolus immersus RN42]